VKEADIPGEVMDDAKTWREKLIEAVAETDDDLLSKYLEEGGIGEEEMLGALGKAVGSGTLVPVLAASSTKGLGIQPLMDLIVKEFPSPADLGAVEGTDPRTKQAVTRAGDPKAPLSAVVFKPTADPPVGKLSRFRVYSATFKADSQVLNATRAGKVRIGHLGHPMGRPQKAVQPPVRGDS